MLTYYEWKKIKDWVLWILDKGTFLAEGAIEIGLAEFGIVPPFSSAIAWIAVKAIKWGVGWLLDLIPHEAERGIGVHKGNMNEFRKLGDDAPTVVELKQTAKAIPLVPLRIPASQRTVIQAPATGVVPLIPLDKPHGFSPITIFSDPTIVDKRQIMRTDKLTHQTHIQKTAPFLYTGSPITGAPRRGFWDPAEAFNKGRKLYSS